VEDDPDQLALADVRVSLAGYAVRVANSQAGLLRSLAKDGRPDLILLDLILPDGDGFDILQRLRRLESFKNLPIVLLTIRGRIDEIAKGLALGADGYITKPYSKNTLAKVIKRIMPPA
jgi:two-component system OmpR family response regulator